LNRLLRSSDPRILQDQTYAFAFQEYRELRDSQPFQSNKFDDATTVARIFDLDASFFIYADTYGLETTLEYWHNLEESRRELERSQIMNLFKDEDETKDG